MRFVWFDDGTLPGFIVCGKLLSMDGFLHSRRVLDENVLILVTEGCLHVSAGESRFSVSAGEFVMLRAGEEHFGWRKSSGRIEYMWVHFRLDFHAVFRGAADGADSHLYAVPECGGGAFTGRASLLFNQLLDFYMEESFSIAECSFSLGVLLMEISRRCSGSGQTALHPAVYSACSWIRANYPRSFSVSELAREVALQPAYLSTLFRRQTGLPIKQYTMRIRLEAAKRLLACRGLSVKEVSFSCGFDDEKYFMKIFREHEGMTPGMYRSAFFRKNIN